MNNWEISRVEERRKHFLTKEETCQTVGVRRQREEKVNNLELMEEEVKYHGM